MMANELPRAQGSLAAGSTDQSDNTQRFKRKLLSSVFITITPKGGAGKTETAECLEAALTIGGASCQLVDVDDGNRGIARRVGPDNVTKLEWATPVTAAADWVARHSDAGSMIFDLGAGIDSADLPVMAFLGSVWRMLADNGAKIVICAVVSTNAPTSAFVERIDRRFGILGEIIIVCNNQDGSREFPPELSVLPQRKVQLGQLASGVQALRLSRRERLSSVLINPAPGYRLASAIMATRILQFARQPVIGEFIPDDALQLLTLLSEPAPKYLHYAVSTRNRATDQFIKQQSAIVANVERALRTCGLSDEDILIQAHEYRRQHAAMSKLLNAIPSS